MIAQNHSTTLFEPAGPPPADTPTASLDLCPIPAAPLGVKPSLASHRDGLPLRAAVPRGPAAAVLRGIGQAHPLSFVMLLAAPLLLCAVAFAAHAAGIYTSTGRLAAGYALAAASLAVVVTLLIGAGLLIQTIRSLVRRLEQTIDERLASR
ncbi:MAG: hypothetical protein OHK0015_33260 [Chloroflexi bacterium OHK40]